MMLLLIFYNVKVPTDTESMAIVFTTIFFFNFGTTVTKVVFLDNCISQSISFDLSVDLGEKCHEQSDLRAPTNSRSYVKSNNILH